MTGGPELLALFLRFLLLGFMAVGGTSTVMPGIYSFLVDEHGWLTARQFADLFALAQASPGPNMLWVTLVGLQAGGWSAAAAATLAVVGPAAGLSFAVGAMQARNPRARLGVALRRGLAPVAVGFVLSSSWLLARAADHGWRGWLLTLLTLAAVLRTRVNPLWLVAAGAAAGAAGLL